MKFLFDSPLFKEIQLRKVHEKRNLPGHVCAIYDFLCEIVIHKNPHNVYSRPQWNTCELKWVWFASERSMEETLLVLPGLRDQCISELTDGFLYRFGVQPEQLFIWHWHCVLSVIVALDLSKSLCSKELKRLQTRFNNQKVADAEHLRRIRQTAAEKYS